MRRSGSSSGGRPGVRCVTVCEVEAGGSVCHYQLSHCVRVGCGRTKSEQGGEEHVFDGGGGFPDGAGRRWPQVFSA